MFRKDDGEPDWTVPPFDRYKAIQPLATDRSGRGSVEHARHRLHVARDRDTGAQVLIKITAKPGIVYERNLENEIASLTTINRKLPDSDDFPHVREHGRLSDGRKYLVTSLFPEFPLATRIAAEPMPQRLVAHLRTALEVARALADLHRLPIFHVDLNPMNILHRVEQGRPHIRLVDFESSYEVARHSTGVFYDPPTTPGYSAPEVGHRPPDARADVFSLGAVLYTMVAGFGWTWEGEVGACVAADRDLDPELHAILAGAVAADPERRTRSIDELRTSLASYLERIWPGRSW
jgi:serine/threonine protein kinase